MSSEDSEFLERFAEIARSMGWRRIIGPSQLVGDWELFVVNCEDGYGGTIYDFENERRVRDLLGAVLSDPILAEFSAMAGLRKPVEAIDARFRAICRDDVWMGAADDAWWRRCVPARADGDFAEDLLSHYKIGPA